MKSFNSASDKVTIQLIQQGHSEPAYETIVPSGTKEGNQYTVSYTISGIASGTYTMRVMKNKHVTREYTVTVSGEAVTQNAEIWLLGDVNGDGVRDMTDVVQICRRFNGKTSVFGNGDALTRAYRLKVADIYADNSIDTTDINQILRYYNGKSSALN